MFKTPKAEPVINAVLRNDFVVTFDTVSLIVVQNVALQKACVNLICFAPLAAGRPDQAKPDIGKWANLPGQKSQLP